MRPDDGVDRLSQRLGASFASGPLAVAERQFVRIDAPLAVFFVRGEPALLDQVADLPLGPAHPAGGLREREFHGALSLS